MSSIWFDITSTYAWNRPAVGVIRVETECVKYALTVSDAKVRFCRFIAGQGYVEISRADVVEMLSNLSGSTYVAAATRVSGMPANVRTGGATRIAARLRKATGLLPRSIGDRLFLYAARRKPSVLTLVESGRQLRQAVGLWFRPTKLATAPNIRDAPAVLGNVPFEADDVYVTLGLDWDQKDLPFIARAKRAIGFKTVFCCYDLIPVKYPHLCVGDVASKFARYFCDLAWCSDEIVSISECSKHDLSNLLKSLGAPVPPNTVITLGSDLKRVSNDKLSKAVQTLASERYILYVSTIERRKNHEVLYRAYIRLVEQGIENLPKLIFVGMQGWGVSDFLADLSLDPRIRNRVVLLSNISDNDLASLYQNALFTVFPSFYEGWGLGVAESLANGKMCLASDAGSLPEVGGDLVEYIDPFDTLKWTEKLLWYSENRYALAEAEKKIASNYEAPIWTNTGRQVFEIARALLPTHTRNS
ncbi:glycosyltransferase family 4 protein [Aurantimonas coralicida]|uniref:glycosyltransferase family 4 protein n=1 Tax=Aurantimonas coralicida TaxID=182270 RepID=UPI00041636B6|nr:glycosyltransferase family 1 protein [Aurantimonas coralicida]